MTAIQYALQLHLPRYTNSHILVRSDNVTAIKYAFKSGGTASVELQLLAIQIQDLCRKFGVMVSTYPGDREYTSRYFEPDKGTYVREDTAVETIPQDTEEMDKGILDHRCSRNDEQHSMS